jgi:hypothetical protein
VLTAVSGGAPSGFSQVFCAEVDVFGVKVYATGDVEDEKALHAAHVLAQYLDNDEDGQVDNPAVLEAMTDRKAAMVMFGNESTFESFDIEEYISPDTLDSMVLQDLYGAETHPGFTGSGNFDASLEEVLHLMTHGGYAHAYPEAFAETPGSRLTDAMDVARGGHFEAIPSSYPPEAWYHYDDDTCDYACMATEYLYWALTTQLGAQAQRCEDIAHEWEPCTPEALASTDLAITELLTNPAFAVPTALPDGRYRE